MPKSANIVLMSAKKSATERKNSAKIVLKSANIALNSASEHNNSAKERQYRATIYQTIKRASKKLATDRVLKKSAS